MRLSRNRDTDIQHGGYAACVVRGAVLGALAGCGRVVAGSTPDAAVDSANGGSGDAAAARCNPTVAFGRPMALTSLNTATANHEHAELSADELTLYFSSTRPGGAGGFDLYQATRNSTSAPFGGVAPVPGVNTMDDERAPRMAADGLSIFANVRSAASPGFRIALATRASVTVAFPGLQPVANVNGAANNADPYLVAGGNAMYLAAGPSGSFDLFRSARSNGAFASPSPVPGVNLNTADVENSPVVTPDELTLFFASNRPGGLGGTDIYEARRSNVADGFGDPVALTGLNTADSEGPNWISPDGCNLYFTRLDSKLGFYQLYMASRGR